MVKADFTRLHWRERKALLDAITASSDHPEALHTWFARVVVWDYEQDASDPATYERLNMVQYGEVEKAFVEAYVTFRQRTDVRFNRASDVPGSDGAPGAGSGGDSAVADAAATDR